MKKRKIVALVCVATVLLLAVSAFWYSYSDAVVVVFVLQKNEVSEHG